MLTIFNQLPRKFLKMMNKNMINIKEHFKKHLKLFQRTRKLFFIILVRVEVAYSLMFSQQLRKLKEKFSYMQLKKISTLSKLSKRDLERINGKIM